MRPTPVLRRRRHWPTFRLDVSFRSSEHLVRAGYRRGERYIHRPLGSPRSLHRQSCVPQIDPWWSEMQGVREDIWLHWLLDLSRSSWSGWSWSTALSIWTRTCS